MNNSSPVRLPKVVVIKNHQPGSIKLNSNNS